MRRRENVIKVKSVLLMPVSSFVVWFTVLTVLQKVHLLLQARNQCEYVISVLRTSHQAQPRYTPLILFYIPNSQSCFVSQGDVYYVTSYPSRYLIAQIATTAMHYTPQVLVADHDVTRTVDYFTLQSNGAYHGNGFWLSASLMTMMMTS